MTRRQNECPMYLPVATVHQQLEPSCSELLYYSPWRADACSQAEDVSLDLNRHVSDFKRAILEAIDEWHATWERKEMKKAYPGMSSKELEKDEAKRSPQPHHLWMFMHHWKKEMDKLALEVATRLGWDTQSKDAEVPHLTPDELRAIEDLAFSMMVPAAGVRRLHYSGGSTIIYNHIFSNIHPAGTGGWDPVNNTFTCPITSYYHFFLSLYKSDSS